MKNLKYFPFERNQYYYGKLLTEQDFIQEQRYMNDKRRLHNRLLHGVGVAAGFQVVQVDEKNISIEAGLALDFAGREIVSDMPVMRRLSTIDGFDTVMENGRGDYIYLCVEYSEKDDVPSYNAAAGRTMGQDKTDYEKIKEGYHLYLTDREPDRLSMTPDSLVEGEAVLYKDSQIQIIQRFPRFVKGGENFETVISIENKGNAVSLSFEAQEYLSGLAWSGKDRLDISIEGIFLEKGEKEERPLTLKAMDLQGGDGTFSLKPENFLLTLGGEKKRLASQQEISIPIADCSRMEAMKEGFFHESMEDAIRDSYPQGIYLSRIYLVKREEAYVIDKIENMPFRQYVYSSCLTAAMTDLLKKEGWEGGKKPAASQAVPFQEKETGEKIRWRMAQGAVKISLGAGGKRGQRFFSHEIFHGLGLGAVHIDLSIQEEDILYGGSSEVFEDMEVRAELASKADMGKGSFVIGLRLLEPSSRQTISVYWKAVMADQERGMQDEEKRIYIVPGKLEMKVRESYCLEAVCENLPGAEVVWNTYGEDGGFISQDGVYTAPDVPGVYEVTASCQDAPEIKASLFVIVRE